MKKIVISVLILFTASAASAKCGFGSISFLSNNTLNKNGILIMQFYSCNPYFIKGIDKIYKLYLMADDSKIELQPSEIYKGAYHLSQLILKPLKELKQNTVYTFQVEEIPRPLKRAESFEDHLMKQLKGKQFKVNSITDTEKPVLASQPVEIKKTLIQYGCGPATWVYFSLKNSAASEPFVKAKVSNKNTGNETSFILPIQDGVVKIGHGMCSGGFKFDNGNNFEVTFQLMDPSGNYSNASIPVTFTKPDHYTAEE